MALASKVGKLGLGFGVIDGGMTFFDRRSQHPEESVAKSALYAGAEAALWTFLPGVAMAKEAFDVTKSLTANGALDYHQYESKAINRGTVGASWNYQDTQQAATMRQRGMEAISQSRMNARSALGGEARALHRGAL